MPEDETAATDMDYTEAERSLIEKRLYARLAAARSMDRQASEPADIAPLSDAQERLWIQHKLEPESPVAHRPLAFRLQGRLDEAVLERCLSEITRRHASLRTVYELEDGEPVQRVLGARPVRVHKIDLTSVPQAERLREARRVAAEATHQLFDLESGPMHPPRLLRLAAEDHVLLLLLHHIAFDGWSAEIFEDELRRLYSAFEHGTRSPLAALPMQYVDFARWQRQRQAAGGDAASLAYWRGQLAGLAPELALPTDHPRPTQSLVAGREQPFSLSPETTQALKALSLAEDATLFMTLMAGFQVVLHRYSGQDDLAVRVPVVGRTHPQSEHLIGCFVNTLVLRADLAGDPSFRSVLKRSRRTTLEAMSHQELSFARVVEGLQPERHAGRAPLAQVLFQLRNLPGSAHAESGSLGIVPFSFDTGLVDGFDLSVEMAETGDVVSGTITYSSDLFDAATVERLAGHYRVVLEGIAADVDRSISALPLLTEPERQRLLVEWNDTEEDYDDVCLHMLFEQQVDEQPDAVALVFEGQQMRYGELEARANQLAHHLMALGVGPERCVVVNLARSPEVIVAILGILKAGGAYVPLDPDTPVERLWFMLKDIEATALITDSALLAGLPAHSTPTLVLDEEADQIGERPTDRPATRVSPANLAYVLYTSGTTGRPKGVMIEHRAVAQNIQWLKHTFPLGTADAVLFHTALTFDVSISELFGGLACGARIVIAHPDEEKDPGALTRLMFQQKVTRIHAGPTMLQMLVLQSGFGRCSLRSIITGAEVVPVSLVRQIKGLRDVEVINGYGPTETTIEVSVWPCEQEHTRRALPIGRPIANTQVYVVDEHLNPVPIGVPGELLVGGVQLARGYLNRPKLTAERFIPDPFSNRPGARLYRTGDLVRWLPEGILDFIGRIDTQVKLRGYRIELGEIEAVLGAHPDVRMCAVTVREAQPGDQRLVAYVVSETEPAPERVDLQVYLKQHLMEYMIPSAFVWLSELPLTISGKVNRSVLPDPELGADQKDFEAPRTPLEKEIAKIWQQVLRVEQVGIHDDFFERGGHSLLAVQTVARLRQHLRTIDIPLSLLFTTSTLSAFAAELDQLRTAALGEDEMAHLLSDLEALSDDEAHELLKDSHRKEV